MKQSDNYYNLLLILPPNIEEKVNKELLEKIGKDIETLKGKIEKNESWGKRVLAYPVKKNREGFYHLFTFVIPPSSVTDLDKKIRLEEQIVRFLLTRGAKPKVV